MGPILFQPLPLPYLPWPCGYFAFSFAWQRKQNPYTYWLTFGFWELFICCVYFVMFPLCVFNGKMCNAYWNARDKRLMWWWCCCWRHRSNSNAFYYAPIHPFIHPRMYEHRQSIQAAIHISSKFVNRLLVRWLSRLQFKVEFTLMCTNTF